MSGENVHLSGKKGGHFSEMKNNPFERITCIPVYTCQSGQRLLSSFMSQPLPVAPCSPQGGGSRT